VQALSDHVSDTWFAQVEWTLGGCVQSAIPFAKEKPLTSIGLTGLLFWIGNAHQATFQAVRFLGQFLKDGSRERAG